MPRLDRDKLLSLGRKTGEVEIGSLGGTVVAQELSMAETAKVAEAETLEERFRLLLTFALVDPEPDEELINHLIAEVDDGLFWELIRAVQTVGDQDTKLAEERERDF